MDHSTLIAVLILSPLVGFLINGFRYNKHDYKVSGAIASIAVLASFVSAILLFIELLNKNK